MWKVGNNNMLVDKGNKLGRWIKCTDRYQKGTLFVSLPKPKLQIRILVFFIA